MYFLTVYIWLELLEEVKVDFLEERDEQIVIPCTLSYSPCRTCREAAKLPCLSQGDCQGAPF